MRHMDLPFATLTSPSDQAHFWKPHGEMPIGMAMPSPRTVVVKSLSMTSLHTRGLILNLLKAHRLRLMLSRASWRWNLNVTLRLDTNVQTPTKNTSLFEPVREIGPWQNGVFAEESKPFGSVLIYLLKNEFLDRRQCIADLFCGRNGSHINEEKKASGTWNLAISQTSLGPKLMIIPA